MTEERLAQITHPGPLEAELIAEVRRLREALRKYGGHCKNCVKFDNPVADCDCGWADAIEGE